MEFMRSGRFSVITVVWGRGLSIRTRIFRVGVVTVRHTSEYVSQAVAPPRRRASSRSTSCSTPPAGRSPSSGSPRRRWSTSPGAPAALAPRCTGTSRTRTRCTSRSCTAPRCASPRRLAADRERGRAGHARRSDPRRHRARCGPIRCWRCGSSPRTWPSRWRSARAPSCSGRCRSACIGGTDDVAHGLERARAAGRVAAALDRVAAGDAGRRRRRRSGRMVESFVVPVLIARPDVDEESRMTFSCEKVGARVLRRRRRPVTGQPRRSRRRRSRCSPCFLDADVVGAVGLPITGVEWTSGFPIEVGSTRTVHMRGGLVGYEEFIACEHGVADGVPVQRGVQGRHRGVRRGLPGDRSAAAGVAGSSGRWR